MQTVVAQIEVKTGDLEGNTKRILDVLDSLKTDESFSVPQKTMVVFPELALSGYNCGALFESSEFVDECQNKLNILVEKTKNTNMTIIVGCPRYAYPRTEKNGTIRLHNSVYIIGEGQIIGVSDKILLANDFQHEDRKYFVPGDTPKAFNLWGKTIGVLICEDIWRDDHDRDLVGELKHQHPNMDTVVCCNYSYFTYSKHYMRQNLLRKISSEYAVNTVYVNAVGVGDIAKNVIAYDGHSLVYNKKGKALQPLASFKPQTVKFDLENDSLFVYNDLDSAKMPDPKTSPEDYLNWKYTSIWECLKYTTQNFMDQCHVQNALVSVSGGLDSALVAVMCAKALGTSRCRFISTPSVYNGDVTKALAQQISDKVGVKLHWMPISAAENAILTSCSTGADDNSLEKNNAMISCAEATLRSVFALSLCHPWKASIIATGNHTENILGWATFHDVGSIGLFQPIGDLTKTELYELASWVNHHYNEELIPELLYVGEVVPMAELADSKEDPFDYFLMSGICAEIIRHRKTPRELMADFDNQTLTSDYFPAHWYDVYDYDRAFFEKNVNEAYVRSKKSVFKCAQGAPILIMSPRSRGFSARETLINHYEAELTMYN